MSEGASLDSLIKSADGRSARIGALLSRRDDGSVFGLAPLSAFLGAPEQVYMEGREVGAWRKLRDVETATEIKSSCALISFNVELHRQVQGPLGAIPCRISSAFSAKVRIFGAPDDATGDVVMVRRPVVLAISENQPVNLRETLAIKFAPTAHRHLKLGRLIVTDEAQPLGIVLGGRGDYCLIAPIGELFSEGRFDNALVEEPQASVILAAEESARRDLETELAGDLRWGAPVPELAA
jgi:hypothetical protein